jgi:hypothetical protein
MVMGFGRLRGFWGGFLGIRAQITGAVDGIERAGSRRNRFQWTAYCALRTGFVPSFVLRNWYNMMYKMG